MSRALARFPDLPPLDLYVIVDPSVTAGRGPIALVEAVLAAGVRWFQLRAKTGATGEAVALARQIGARVEQAGGVLVVNDRADVARAAGATGVHLGQEDLPVPLAKGVAPGLVIGASTHGVDQARRAVADGADYVAIGSIYRTASKQAFELVGLEALRQVRSVVGGPLLAIGGITPDRVPEVIAAGADGVAVISAIAAVADPGAAAAAFLDAIREARAGGARPR